MSGLVRFSTPLSAHQQYLVGLLNPLILEVIQSLMTGAEISCPLRARLCFCHNLSPAGLGDGGVGLRPLPLAYTVSRLVFPAPA